MTQQPWPANDPATRRWLPETSKPVDPDRVAKLIAAEWERFTAATPASAEHNRQASKSLPLGVTSSFQHWDPHPISIVKARGAWLTDVDGRTLLDLSMGFGAMLVGHLNPTVVRYVEEALESVGTLFVTPSPVSTEIAERFQERFHLDLLRFTQSGTESLMYAVRAARAYTGRKAIIKIEGGYHGGYDVPFDVEAGTVYVVPYNDLGRLTQILRENGREIAAVVMEPVIENLAIVVPDEGYLAGVRALCDEHGVLLIFDEVKTGLTAGADGALRDLQRQPARDGRRSGRGRGVFA